MRTPAPGARQTLQSWRASSADDAQAQALEALYAPLCHAPGPLVVAHLAQSLDGRIATHSGHSQWLSGEEDLLHTHRMRALFDAVLVGANTVLFDDPRLTVRRCTGSNPVRVVIDPLGRLDGGRQVFRDGAAPTLVLVRDDAPRDAPALGRAEVLRLPGERDAISPHAIREALAARGLSRLFIEGGGITISHFLAAGALDRLQITVAPVLLGSGRHSLVLPRIGDLRDCLRPPTRRFVLGQDVMFECDLHG